jgi:DNA-binding transcriptional ArsR family regulator
MIHERMLELVARRFRVLAEPCRLRILQALEAGAMTVNQIASALDGNQPNISKHLQILFDAGLLGRERSGNSIFYSIADPVVFKLCDLICRSTVRQAAYVQRYGAGVRRRNRIQGQKVLRRLRVASLEGAH